MWRQFDYRQSRLIPTKLVNLPGGWGYADKKNTVHQTLFFGTKQSSRTCTLLSFITEITEIKCQFTVPMSMRLISSSVSNLPHTFPLCISPVSATSSTFRKHACLGWHETRNERRSKVACIPYKECPGFIPQPGNTPSWLICGYRQYLDANTSRHDQKATLLAPKRAFYMYKMTSNGNKHFIPNTAWWDY
jgi:hypothetical protein